MNSLQRLGELLTADGDDAIVVVMSADDRDREREERIERLKVQAASLADGRMVVYESEAMTSELRERFWQTVVAAETAGTTDLITELKAIGVDLPEPDALDDAALHKALWRVINALASLQVFLHGTDHLSDRQLYTQLLREVLPEEMDALDGGEGSAWHVDVLGSHNTELYLKYYADEKTRAVWRKEYSDLHVPPREPLPYDRGRHLPRWP